MKKKRALTTQQYVIIAAVAIIALVGVYYLTRPKVEPEPVPNVSPLVLADVSPYFVKIGDMVSCTGEGSRDPDGNIVQYIWDFGDGTSEEGITAGHTYDAPGDYIVTLSIEDDEGAIVTSDLNPLYVRVDSAEIATLDSPPKSIVASNEQIIKVGNAVSFDGSSSHGWMLYRGGPRADTSKVVKWEWTFGDDTTSVEKNPEHEYAEVGRYKVTLAVEDEAGKTGTSARTIVVLPTTIDYTGQVKNSKIFVYATDLAIISNMDFFISTAQGPGRTASACLTDKLLYQGPGELEPRVENSLSESYEISDDGSEYTFHLREGITFWNGDELKAEDVEYTFERVMGLTAARGRWGDFFEKLTGIPGGEVVPDEAIQNAVEVIDDYTVRFKFAENYAPFIQLTVHADDYGIISKQYAIEHGAWSWDDPRDFGALDGLDVPMSTGEALMATGPFKLTEFKPGEIYAFERNDDYWRGPAHLEGIRYITVPEWSTRLLMLKAGDIDSMNLHNAAEFEQLIDIPSITPLYDKYGGLTEAWYFWHDWDPNQAAPELQVPTDFFQDAHMRKAFAYAFPYEKYIEEVWLGYAEAAKGPLPSGYPGSYDVYPYTYDLEKAEEELKLAHGGKYYEEGFQITVAVQFWAQEIHGTGFKMLEAELQKINPNIKFVQIGATYSDSLNIPAMGCIQGVVQKDPISYRQFYHSDGGWQQYFGYNNPLVDELIDNSTATPFMEERIALVIEAAQIAADEVPCMFTVNTPGFGAMRSYISDYYGAAYYYYLIKP